MSNNSKTLSKLDFADTAFKDRADLQIHIGPPCEAARYSVLSSCILELIRVGAVFSDGEVSRVEPSCILSQLKLYLSVHCRQILHSYPTQKRKYCGTTPIKRFAPHWCCWPWLRSMNANCLTLVTQSSCVSGRKVSLADLYESFHSLPIHASSRLKTTMNALNSDLTEDL